MKKITFNEDQERAINKAVSDRFSLITGAGGTGKTTVIKSIVEKSMDEVMLCCPTGKAAARLREASGLPASTIHSALGFNGTTFMKTGAVRGCHLIIDESSMLDSDLLASIIKCRPKRLTLVGDNAQLPPVGPGQPFHDLIKCVPGNIAELTICYRNSEAIYQAAMMIRQGDQPFSNTSENEVFLMSNTGDIDGTIKYLTAIMARGELDFETDIILSCKNAAVDAINQAVIELLCPGRDICDEKWRVGDRIICNKNFPKIDTWNGTTGTITGIDGDGRVWVKGDLEFYVESLGKYEPEIIWDKEILRECKHAYALTVHKSQGSQYRKVFFASFPGDSFMMLTRSLIYTAVTRSQKECHVIGNLASFRNGVNKIGHRRTVIQVLSGVE